VTEATPREVSVVLFDGFELLDVFGPLEVFGVASVCTGSALLARAGLLDGHRATSNKLAFSWVTTQGEDVEWVARARWVEDRGRWTSSGVAAGIDMTLALVASIDGDERARQLADIIEYDWHADPTWDPFAVKHGLA
jgi:transcriptional regulator GlxA family with amidase domain